MFDLSGSATAGDLQTMIDASKSFVTAVLSTGNKIAVWYFNSQVQELQDFTDDEATLLSLT